jgi:hypothetical protein
LEGRDRQVQGNRQSTPLTLQQIVEHLLMSALLFLRRSLLTATLPPPKLMTTTRLRLRPVMMTRRLTRTRAPAAPAPKTSPTLTRKVRRLFSHRPLERQAHRSLPLVPPQLLPLLPRSLPLLPLRSRSPPRPPPLPPLSRRARPRPRRLPLSLPLPTLLPRPRRCVARSVPFHPSALAHSR